MSYPNVADLSSAQGSFDAAAYAASGRQAVIIKATEHTNYHFSTGETWTQQARSHGLAVGRYHFAGDSMHGVLATPEEEGAWFIACEGEHRPGLFAVVDFEDPINGPALYGLSPSQAAKWCGQFLDFLAHHDWPGMGYSMSGSGVIQQLKAPYKRWYAGYPNLVGVSGPVDLHQFTDHGPVPGVGQCDDSYCFIDLVAFANGVHPPQEEDMQFLVSAPGKPAVFLGSGASWVAVVDGDSLNAFSSAGAKSVTVSPAEYDHIASIAK